MTWLIVGAALLVILTKVADCLSTLRAVRVIGTETNPIGRTLMRRCGIAGGAWLVFGIVVAIVVATACAVLASDSALVQTVFFVLAGVISVVQGAVAHTNATGRWNVITTLVLALHGALGGLLAGWRSGRSRPRSD